jgi:hypothetical protein
VRRFQQERGVSAFVASAATHTGVREATEAAWSLARDAQPAESATPRRTC